MPSALEILAGLTAIANQGVAIAIAWHVILAIALYAVARGWRPPRRAAAVLIAVPLASVAALAFAFGNPFNGTVFTAGFAALVVLAVRGDDRAVARGAAWAWWAGVAMLAFAWVYPHFLAGHPAAYLYAAPLGLVPCPTLSAAIGLALLAGSPGPRAWTLTLAGLGLFYGLFGVARLGVALDLGLVAGAIALGAVGLARPRDR
ncbi:MAG: hypothetical protein K8W52_41635 [Deltaproteobacteria bacterium]|nr:hypothetical protein [Deltaproteobacteria bacterium]